MALFFSIKYLLKMTEVEAEEEMAATVPTTSEDDRKLFVGGLPQVHN